MEGNAELLMAALGHPTRIRILSRMNAPRRRLSPRAFSYETAEELGKVAYHFRALAKAGLIRLVDVQPVRGSMRHTYAPVDRPMAWEQEYECLPEAVRQRFAATALREGVEAVGRSLDAGLFTEAQNAHLSWDSMWVDDEGWRKLGNLLDRTLAEAMAIRDECAERLPDPENESRAKVASYFMSAFPSPNPDDEMA